MTRVRDTFDGAQEWFREQPNAETAAHFRKIATEYHKGEMCGPDTYRAALTETEAYAKPALRWTAGPWETDSRWSNCIVSQRGAPGALGLVRVAEVHYASPEDLALMMASPDMASALQAADDLLGELGRTVADNDSADMIDTVRQAIRVALKKAGAHV